MRYFSIILLLVAISTCSFRASADFVVNDIRYDLTYDGNDIVATVVGLELSYPSDIVNIPASVSRDNDTYNVIGIRSQAFEGKDNITKITIDEGIEYVESMAFRNCTSLINIQLPSSLKNIGVACFQNCSALTDITLPNNIEFLGRYLFYGCSALTNVTLPISINTIPPFTFYECKSLSNVNPLTNIIEIGECSFYGCSSLKSLDPAMAPLTISDNAFRDCSSLVTIPFDIDIVTIGNSAFEGCTALTQLNLSKIDAIFGNSVFAGCTALREVVLPHNIEHITDGMFADCVSLTDLTLPPTLMTIGERAFANTRALTDITLPEKLTDICDFAFSGSGLEAIEFLNQDMSIGEGAFENNIGLETLFISGVYCIGKGAFANCTSLETIEIDDRTHTIETEAFTNCPKLLYIYIRSKVPPTITINTFDNYTETFATLYVMEGYRNTFALATYWDRFLNIHESNNFPTSVVDSLYDMLSIKVSNQTVSLSSYTGQYLLFNISGELIEKGYCNGNIELCPGEGVYVLSTGDNSAIKFIIR